MKQNKKWLVFLLSGLLAITFTGCEDQKEHNLPVASEAASAGSAAEEQEKQSDSIYNGAFEKYSDVTELGVVVNNPTQEDMDSLETVDTYGDDKQEAILIIPKYNGSKITVSSAEYTGEQYIAKDVLFSKESTTAGYGLCLHAYRSEGIPELIVTINYQNMIYKYVVTSNGKDGNTGVEYLRLEPNKGSETQGDYILSVQDATYTKGLNLFSSSEIDMDKDGQNETVELYCDGSLEEDGNYSSDDGQTWALLLRKGDSFYPLFDKARIQLGKLQYTIYEDYEDYDKGHIIIEYKSGTDIYYYDCTYDDESGNMLRRNFFEATNINLIQSWE